MPLHDAYARLTPYERLLPSPEFPARRFAAIEAEAERRGVRLDDPAAFALLEAAAEALEEWTEGSSELDTLAQYALLLFHAYHQHAAGAPVYLFEAPAVRHLLEADPADKADPAEQADAVEEVDSGSPLGSLYLQLPQHMVWARLDIDDPPLSIDGMFCTVTGDGRFHLLPVGGLHGDGPGFTVLPVPSAPLADEATWRTARMRPDGGDFRSSMPGAELEGLYEVTTAGEALQLAARAMQYLRVHPDRARRGAAVKGGTPTPSSLPSQWTIEACVLSAPTPTPMPNRQAALTLLSEWVDNEALQLHMKSVEASVRHYASLRGADPELWGLAGLLHDLDWEKHPETHPVTAVDHLREEGYPDEVLHAILAHRPDYTGVEPETELDRVLYACDELSGLVYACCLVRPNGIDDLTPKSVVKKLKDKAFAAGVDRDDVARGIELIGLDRTAHIQNVIDGMRAVAGDLRIRAEDRARG